MCYWYATNLTENMQTALDSTCSCTAVCTSAFWLTWKTFSLRTFHLLLCVSLFLSNEPAIQIMCELIIIISQFFLLSELAKQLGRLVWIDTYLFRSLSLWFIWSGFSVSKTDSNKILKNGENKQHWMKGTYIKKQLKQNATIWEVTLRKFSCDMWSSHSSRKCFCVFPHCFSLVVIVCEP